MEKKIVKKTAKKKIKKAEEKVFKLPWRPEKYNQDTIEKLSSIFQIDWTISEACSHAWISRETYYSWLEKKEWFSDKMESAKEVCFILARKKLVSDIRNPATDAKSSIEFLRRRDKRYKDKIENEVTGQITNINFEFKEAEHSKINEDWEENEKK